MNCWLTSTLIGFFLITLAACASAPERSIDDQAATIEKTTSNNPEMDENIKNMMNQRMKEMMGSIQAGGKNTTSKETTTGEQTTATNEGKPPELQNNMNQIMQDNMKQMMQQNMQQQKNMFGQSAGSGNTGGRPAGTGSMQPR